MESPAAPFSPSTHPPIIMDKLEVGSLYIMISIPFSIYFAKKKHIYATNLPDGPNFPFCTYELMVSQGLSTEEFHWDLYWHASDPATDELITTNVNQYASRSADDDGNGILYRLRPLETCPTIYTRDRLTITRVRSHAQLVGLIRVLTVPPAFILHLTRYLDWMTAESARVAERSYIKGARDHTFHQFDISRFTAELLSFAYAEVPSALSFGGMGMPRPVVAS
ncbi:uncharacterized protein BDZ83DRAFT_752903 [Colletotrichum acutatum]|uniref:Uncharacterized protein n=1 Tax=Glomerella acutata TaxID=27357 RepID=A0AAD8UJS5_GLOAC|nr:uncharacterized protein BDZ83DRAFT_752903 [Colletotrichum acutatum]KAK1724072.1 hypothetical protein BDZ83DRAFT_752903 [Colletotrichum acutatum]